MATIAQIIAYMNENKMIWQPLDIVEITVKPNQEDAEHPGYAIAECEPDKVFEKQIQKKWIGHYYLWVNDGNIVSGMVLIPLNNKKYLKAIYYTNS